MNKLKNRKLALNAETLKTLTDAQTEGVVGGVGGEIAAELTKDRTEYLCTCKCPVNN